MVQNFSVGDIIRMRSWHGVILDVFTGETGHHVLRVQTARNIFRRLGPEFIDVGIAPGALEAASIDDLMMEIEALRSYQDKEIDRLVQAANLNG